MTLLYHDLKWTLFLADVTDVTTNGFYSIWYRVPLSSATTICHNTAVSRIWLPLSPSFVCNLRTIRPFPSIPIFDKANPKRLFEIESSCNIEFLMAYSAGFICPYQWSEEEEHKDFEACGAWEANLWRLSVRRCFNFHSKISVSVLMTVKNTKLTEQEVGDITANDSNECPWDRKKMWIWTWVCVSLRAVAFVVVAQQLASELASLAVSAHATVVLAKWSHSPGKTRARRLWRGRLSLTRTSINHTIATERCSSASL